MTGTTAELEELHDAGERRSDLDGFTIIPRAGRAPRVHLLRPYPECHASGDKRAIRIEGGREHLQAALAELGARTGGSACRRCFPKSSDADTLTPVEEYAGDEIEHTLDKYQEEPDR